MEKAMDRRVLDVRRRGKQIFILIEEGVITLHLGMTGAVLLGTASEAKHVAVRLHFDDGSCLDYIDPRRFGAIGFASSMETFITAHRLGEDVLKIGLDAFSKKAAASHRPIKSFLLDQSKVAGIGNLYGDEALFQAGLHPLRHGSSLNDDETRRLWQAAQRVLRRSLSVNTDFSLLPSGYLLCDRVVGRPCPRCRAPLSSMLVGGRTSIYCPSCQTVQF